MYVYVYFKGKYHDCQISLQLGLFLQDVPESPKIGIPKVSTDDFYLAKFSAAVVSCKSIILVPALIAN